jgi:branched-chain amino acid transport system substrate-binding protein
LVIQCAKQETAGVERGLAIVGNGTTSHGLRGSTIRKGEIVFKHHKLVRVAVVTAALGLVAAACGSSSTKKAASTTAASTKATDAPTTTVKAPDAATTTAAPAKPATGCAAGPGADTAGKNSGWVAWAEACGKEKALKATGDPIVIGVQNPEGDPAGSFPEYSLAAKAAGDYINNELGGIGADYKAGKPGRPVKIEVCVMAINPADSQKCANELAAKKPFTVLSSLNFFGNHFPIYTAAKIPVVVGTPITPGDFTTPGVYAIGGGGGCLGVHTGLIGFTTKELKKTKVAVPWSNTPPGVFCYHDLEKKPLSVLSGKKLDGSPMVAKDNANLGTIANLTQIGVPADPGKDKNPAATAVLAFKPDSIIFSGQGADCWDLVTALDKLGWKSSTTPLILSGACLDLAKMKELGDITKGIYFVGSASILNPESLKGQLKAEAVTYGEKMAKYSDKETGGKGFATVGFESIMQIWEVATTLANGDVTKIDSAAFAAALAATKGHHAWGSTGLSCADGAANAPYVAVCNSIVTATQWDGAKLNTIKEDFGALDLIKGTELDFGK